MSQKFSNQVVVVCASIPDITPIMSSLRLMVTSQSLGFSLRPEAGHYERRVSGEIRRNVGSEAGYCKAGGEDFELTKLSLLDLIRVVLSS